MTFSKETRPERQHLQQERQAAVYYEGNGASRYTTAAERTGIQEDLTLRALALLLSAFVMREGKETECGPWITLDLGCGSGLSSSILSSFGFFVLGADISREMLRLASLSTSCAFSPSPGKKKDTKTVNQEEGIKEKERALSLPKGWIEIDMSQGLPVRPGSVDAVISISALQWLLGEEKDATVTRVRRLARALSLSLTSKGLAVFQLYPEQVRQMHWLREALDTEGWSTHYVLDYPHRTAARKHFLLLGRKKHDEPEHAAAAGEALSLPLVAPYRCPLAFPYDSAGVCAHGWWSSLACRAHEPSVLSSSRLELVKKTASRGKERVETEHIQYAHRILRTRRRLGSVQQRATEDRDKQLAGPEENIIGLQDSDRATSVRDTDDRKRRGEGNRELGDKKARLSPTGPAVQLNSDDMERCERLRMSFDLPLDFSSVPSKADLQARVSVVISCLHLPPVLELSL